MITIENVETAGWEPAARGMRNPMNSWSKADSGWGQYSIIGYKNIPQQNNFYYHIGPDDGDLMMRLRNAGTDHRKFLRMIICYVDITAPLYWWKEADTYRNGVEKNSCSTMHKISEHEFTLDDFSVEHLEWQNLDVVKQTISRLNVSRMQYLNEGKTKDLWWQMIQLLPSTYNQRRTVMMSYEALANMYHARKAHKLDEWREFCKWIKTLPFSELITGDEINE